MPRQARQISETGIYHIMVRGINRQDIFHDEEDRQRYLETLQRIFINSNCEVLGYCLMSNHVHLLIKEGDNNISNVMKRLGVSYAYYYNLKYGHSGHVFQDRFKSECVEDDKYLLTVLRYIHCNPVKAKIVPKIEEYPWSSSQAYYGNRENPTGLTKTQLILGLYDEQKEKAVEKMCRFEAEDNDDQCLEGTDQNRLSQEAVRRLIVDKLDGRPPEILQQMSTQERNEILQEIKAIDGISLRQIARITGLTVHAIFKV